MTTLIPTRELPLVHLMSLKQCEEAHEVARESDVGRRGLDSRGRWRKARLSPPVEAQWHQRAPQRYSYPATDWPRMARAMPMTEALRGRPSSQKPRQGKP